MKEKLKKTKLSFSSVKAVIGSLIIIAGILGGAYVGIYLMFIGGIIQLINVIRATVLIPSDVAIGIAKILFCELAGLIPVVGILVGGVLIASDN